MMNSRSIQQPPSKTLRKVPGKKASVQAPDATEFILAELRVRRERLNQLLNMIHLEAGRLDAAPKPSQPHRKCSAARRSSQP